MTPALWRHASIAVLLALLSTTFAMVASAPAEAAAKPGKVSLKKTRHATTTSTLTISWKRPKHAKRFAVCVKSSTKAKKCTRFSRTRKTTVTYRGLKPTGGTDYVYRIRSYNGSRTTVTGWKKANLRVARGSTSTAIAGSGSTLTFSWPKVVNAGSYRIQLSEVPSFANPVRSRTVKGRTHRFTGLNGGMTYYMRLRGLNGVVQGAWGPRSSATLTAVPIDATVVTYNLCGENRCRSSSSPAWFLRNVPPWATRKPIAGALVRSASPDIVLTQESANSTAFQTQLPGFTRGGYKSAKAIFYKTSRFTSLRDGWMTLDPQTSRYASWSLLRDRRTGTTFYVVDAHLEPYKGATLDQRRDAQVRRLIRRMTTINTQSLPIIWGGDWNSNKANANQSKYPGGYDAPRLRFEQIGVANAVDLTDDRTNADLNSANQGIAGSAKTPLRANGDHIDAIYVPTTGVQVRSWAMLANLVTTEWGRSYTLPLGSDHNPVVARLVIGSP